jgi:hypothetical protein
MVAKQIVFPELLSSGKISFFGGLTSCYFKYSAIVFKVCERPSDFKGKRLTSRITKDWVELKRIIG